MRIYFLPKDIDPEDTIIISFPEFINDLISFDKEFSHLVFTVLFLELIIIEEPILITILLYLFNIFIVYLLNLF